MTQSVDYYYRVNLSRTFPLETGKFYQYQPINSNFSSTFGSPKIPPYTNVYCLGVVVTPEIVYAKFLHNTEIVRISPIFFSELQKQKE